MTVSIEHIELDEKGIARIAGTRSRVINVVLDAQNGLTPSQIHEAYLTCPWLKSMPLWHTTTTTRPSSMFKSRKSCSASNTCGRSPNNPIERYFRGAWSETRKGIGDSNAAAVHGSHIRREIVQALRRRGIEVLRAQEDGTASLPDAELLDRATSLERVLFSQDTDLLAEAAAWQRRGQRFAGVIFAHQLRITIGQCIDDLALVAKVYSPEEMRDQVLYLPL